MASSASKSSLRSEVIRLGAELDRVRSTQREIAVKLIECCDTDTDGIEHVKRAVINLAQELLYAEEPQPTELYLRLKPERGALYCLN